MFKDAILYWKPIEQPEPKAGEFEYLRAAQEALVNGAFRLPPKKLLTVRSERSDDLVESIRYAFGAMMIGTPLSSWRTPFGDVTVDPVATRDYAARQQLMASSVMQPGEQIKSFDNVNGIYVAVGDRGTVVESVDGMTWTQRTPNPCKEIEVARVTRPTTSVKYTSGCPRCGHEGEFVRMALTCPTHGVFGGC